MGGGFQAHLLHGAFSPYGVFQRSASTDSAADRCDLGLGLREVDVGPSLTKTETGHSLNTAWMNSAGWPRRCFERLGCIASRSDGGHARPGNPSLFLRYPDIQSHVWATPSESVCHLDGGTHGCVGARNLNGSLFSKFPDWSPTTSGWPARVNFRTPVPSWKSILSSFTHRAPGLLVS